MEQFVNDLRDIILGLLHLIVWLVHAIAWIVRAIGWLIHGIVLLFHAVGWLLHHWPWLLAAAGLFVLVVYVVPTIAPQLEGRDIMALFKRKPAEIEQLSSSTQLAKAEMSDSQRAIHDLVWAVRNNDAAEVNAAIKQIQQTKGAWPETKPGRLTAEVTETETNTKTITVKKRLVVG